MRGWSHKNPFDWCLGPLGMVGSDTPSLAGAGAMTSTSCPAVAVRGRGESLPESGLLQVIPPSPGMCGNSSCAEFG